MATQLLANMMMLISALNDGRSDELPRIAVARLGAMRFRLAGDIEQVRFSPDATHVAAVARGGAVVAYSIFIFDAQRGTIFKRLTVPEHHTVYGACYAPDGERLATSDSGAVRVWSTRTWEEIARIEVAEGEIAKAVAFSPDGRLLGLVRTDDEHAFLDILDAASQRHLRRFTAGVYRFDHIAFSSGNPFVAGSDERRRVKVWECSSGLATFDFEMPEGAPEIKSLCFSPDGAMLVVGSRGRDNSICLWDIRHAGRSIPISQQPRRIIGHKSSVSALAFSPSGEVLASGSHDRTIRLWDPASGKEIAKLDGHREGITSIDFSRDGRWLASGDHAGVIQIWDVAKRAARDPVAPNLGRIESVAFAPDGKTVASGGQDRMLRLWDLSNGTATSTAEHPDFRIAEVAFSPDGKILMVADGDQQRPSKLGHSIRGYDPTTG